MDTEITKNIGWAPGDRWPSHGDPGPPGPLGNPGSPGDCKVFCMSFACPRVFWGKFGQVGTVLDKIGQFWTSWAEFVGVCNNLGLIMGQFETIWHQKPSCLSHVFCVMSFDFLNFTGQK